MRNTIEYTDFFTPASSLVDDVYYNANRRILVVDLNDSLYRYYNVSQAAYNEFAAADSAGSYYNTVIKRTYGPGDFLGDYDDFDYKRVGNSSEQNVTNVTVNAADIASANVIDKSKFDLKPFASDKVPSARNLKHTVKFTVDGGDATVREFNTEGGTDVQASIDALTDVANMIGLTFTVKEVCVTVG